MTRATGAFGVAVAGWPALGASCSAAAVRPCVSDKPLHGELKLPGQANRFYEEAIAAHLQIGIRTCEILHDEGAKLHSRKLRAFNEPPFR